MKQIVKRILANAFLRIARAAIEELIEEKLSKDRQPEKRGVGK